MKLPCSSKESFFFGLQSRCLIKFHGPCILHLKRFIVGNHSWISINVENNFLGARGKKLKLNQRSRGSLELGYIYMGSVGSSSSLMNSSTSFSRRDSSESTRRIHVTSSIGLESRYGSIMEFVALMIWTEMVSFPRWTLSLF